MASQTAPATNQEEQAQMLEHGDIYFFYRPKVGSEQVKSINDVRRFFMVMAPEGRQQQQLRQKQKRLYRLFVIGKKSLPEIRKSEARASERYWARVGGIFQDANELTEELLSDEFRQGDAARPVGEGKYAIVKHQTHTELAYILEIPNEPGQAQNELGIEKEASYVISVINPKIPVPAGYPGTEVPPKYPKEILQQLSETENFVPLSRDTKLIDYQNAQVILIGAREGHDIIKKEIGIEIKYDKNQTAESSSADIFKKLKVHKEQVPIRPLTEGKLE
jgi:hypothetical protein